MVGKGVLLECLDSNEVEKVLIVNRQSIGLSHEKLTEVLVPDFFDLVAIEKELEGYNTCYFCLGISAAGESEDSYSKITYDLTLNFAKTILKLNTELKFCYVSGAGTDSSEKSSMMWARVKGKTENALLGLGFKDAYMFRPGIIQPLRNVKAKSGIVNFSYMLMGPLFSIFQKFPNLATDTVKVGKAMINIVLNPQEKKVIGGYEINMLAG